MFRATLMIMVAVCFGWLCFIPHVQSKPLAFSEWSKQKAVFFRLMNGDPAMRMKGIQSLSTATDPEAMEIMINLYAQLNTSLRTIEDIALRGNKQRELDAVFEIATTYRSTQMLETLCEEGLLDKKELKREFALRILAMQPTPDALSFLHRAATKKYSKVQTWMLIDCIGVSGDESSIAVLSELVPKKKDWRGRLAVIQALDVIHDIRTVPLLIQCMEHDRLKLRLSSRQALVRLSAMAYQTQAQWQQWYDDNKTAIDEGTFISTKSQVDNNDGSSFYGMTLDSDRTIFILDISGSMKEEFVGLKKYEGKTRLEALKSEITSMLREYDASSRFTLLVYCHEIHFWKESMQPGTKPAIHSATAFVDRLNAFGGTNVYDALQATFDLAWKDTVNGADSIYLLSDGIPTTGKLVEPDDILNKVLSLNRQQRLTINTVFVGEEAEGENFMQTLAKQHRGRCVSFRPKPKKQDEDE